MSVMSIFFSLKFNVQCTKESMRVCSRGGIQSGLNFRYEIQVIGYAGEMRKGRARDGKRVSNLDATKLNWQVPLSVELVLKRSKSCQLVLINIEDYYNNCYSAVIWGAFLAPVISNNK